MRSEGFALTSGSAPRLRPPAEAEKPALISANLCVGAAKAAKADGADAPFVEAGLGRTEGKGFEEGVGVR